jgi:hypothetical protein
MAIRAIDYCPPVEFEYEDFLEAILLSDRQVAPDDEHRYRESVEAGFAAYGIGRPPRQVVEMMKLKVRPKYERFSLPALQSDKDEVWRFLWENDKLLRIPLDFVTTVESVRPSIRVGPDGFVVRETVVTYVQQVDGTAAELQALSQHVRSPLTDCVLEIPDRISSDTDLRMYGGGAIIFDQFGRPKFHQHKHLLDWERQSRRLEYLADRPDTSSSTRLGAPPSSSVEPLAAIHRADSFASERW